VSYHAQLWVAKRGGQLSLGPLLNLLVRYQCGSPSLRGVATQAFRPLGPIQHKVIYIRIGPKKVLEVPTNSKDFTTKTRISDDSKF
jgi:hypothetical protein